MLIIGIASAIVDNVPLVAASMGMYSLAQFRRITFYGHSLLTVRVRAGQY